MDDEAELVAYRLNALPDKLGPKHGGRFARIGKALGNLDPKEAAREIAAGSSLRVPVDGRVYTILPEEVEIERLPKEGYSIAAEDEYVVAVSTEITPALKREGLARDLVRHIQEMRKEADLNLTDRILTYYKGDKLIKEVFQTQSEQIKRETLSNELIEEELEGQEKSKTLSLDGESVQLWIRKVS